MEHILLVIHILLCIGIVFMVLIQRSDADGMGGLSGGSTNMSSFLTGRAAANLLTKTTALLAAGFFITSLGLTYLSSAKSGKSILDKAPAVQESTPQNPAKSGDNESNMPTVPMAK